MKKRSSIITLIASATLLLSSSSYAIGSKHGVEGDEHKKHGGGVSWGYEGPRGPEHWGNLSEKFILCKTGEIQSPIDIKGPFKKTGAPSIDIRYKPTSSLEMIDDGHTIKEIYGPGSLMSDDDLTIKEAYEAGSFLVIDGKPYQLLQFHFHGPSEHKIKGKSAAMEVHLVHQSTDKELAVVGILIEEGKEHKALNKIWKRMPEDVGEKVIITGKKAVFDATSLLPREKAFFHYVGSLTTPPCSEGVRWFVMKDAIEFSKGQIEKFKRVIGEDARPIQPRQGRPVFESN
uniref:carbonic anhydrase n=1 Tax=Candidatus Kentrum sp. LFY TaxID=2126342 RepID=A0A450U542_9GAMM|nr:MAG: carbonic anhydrase [Candidatus Kentron sp. LFY]VFJ92668.1 MAG: carbonic anhydrase [Candidatus Kentron sp. LFY]